MKNLLMEFPKYKDRIKSFISIFCAGMPSYNASIMTWQMSGRTDEPVSLKYRGDGWPGNFCAKWNDGTDFQLSYNDSWGKVLGRQLGFRCKICPDGIGMLADVAVGDSWTTKNGYPDFTESEGRCFVMVRSSNGKDIMERAEKNGYVVRKSLDINKIAEMQSYQYNRRKLEGWRLVPVQLFSGFMLKFKGLHIFRQALSAKFTTGIKNMLGTAKRMIKN
jgi:coenzyme F420 hydrogenase subunit beta